MIENAIRTIRTLLPASGSATPEEITEAVNDILSIPKYAGIDRSALLKEVESIYTIRIDDFRVIESQERRYPWLAAKKASVQWSFWNRYRDYLQIEKNFAPEVLGGLDRLTDKILDSVFDPAQKVVIAKKGLVVGQVQSEKTSNYTGVICKAADAGFKLIIVLAGIHNNLRSQTQLRIDEGFLGFDTQHERAFKQNNKWIGVGNLDRKIVAHSLTSSLDDGDFKIKAPKITFDTNEPIIAVVKKNVKVLEDLLQWLYKEADDLPNGTKSITTKSLLLIDDEADNASINTKPENDDATRTNSLIRDILRLFDKSSYVGYTATPFANIFIPIQDDDLFPRDFIINLPAPSNYIGPEQVFGFELREEDEDETQRSVLPIINRISDHISFVPGSTQRDHKTPALVPDSLHLAIRCFIITCAVRRLRGQTAVHNSMLIHVSRYIKWQSGLKGLIERVFDFYRLGIELNTPEILEELRKTFEEDNDTYKSYTTTFRLIRNSEELRALDPKIEVHSWQQVLKHLHEAASRIMVREINGGSADVLNYFDHKNGLSVIAIGGDKLSRGLTLEGLSVSYYLRESKMYDSLMQMGRWFGYRPGYIDLCRLFISRDLNEWFCHVTHASQQLREEFDYMADVAGSTPDQFALQVRTHPGVLQISASNKIRRAVEITVSWSGRLVESYELSKKTSVIESNLTAAHTLIHSLGKNFEPGKNYYLWRNVNLALVKVFLRSFQTHDNLKSAAPANVLRFIEMNEKYGDLNSWAVGVISKEKTDSREFITKPGISIGMVKRTQDDKSTDEIYYIKKSHIISPDDEFIDLSEDEKKKALELTSASWQKKKKEGTPVYPNGEIVRNTIRKPNHPLLLIYFLDPSGTTPAVSKPVIGYAISFPANDRKDAVTFAVHEQLLAQFNQQEHEEIEQPEDED